MPRFRVISGHHIDRGRVYRSGDVIDTKINLKKLVDPERFELLPGGAEEHPASAKIIVIGGNQHEANLRTAPPEMKQMVLGRDVTADFPEAEDAGLRVFKLQGLFRVVPPDSDEPINKTGVGQDDVAGVVEQYQRENGDG